MNRKKAILRAHVARENAKFGFNLVCMPTEQWPPERGPTMPGGKRQAAWRSRDFLVQLFEEHNGATRLTISRTELGRNGDFLDGITWDQIQWIKSQIGMGEKWAVEIFPPDEELVNVGNLRHIWLLDTPPAFVWKNKPVGAAAGRKEAFAESVPTFDEGAE